MLRMPGTCSAMSRLDHYAATGPRRESPGGTPRNRIGPIQLEGSKKRSDSPPPSLGPASSIPLTTIVGSFALRVAHVRFARFTAKCPSSRFGLHLATRQDLFPRTPFRDCRDGSANAAVMVNTLVIVRPLNAVPTGRTNTTGQPHVCAQQPRVCTPEGTPPRLVAELRLTQDRRDMTIRVAERAWV